MLPVKWEYTIKVIKVNAQQSAVGQDISGNTDIQIYVTFHVQVLNSK
jgi:hypothetical protein